MDILDQQNAWELDHKLNTAMEALRCPRRKSANKSFIRRRTAQSRVCRLLLSNPDILLLDEPTNHLDAESVFMALSNICKSFPGTVIAVTHDRYFLDNVASWILEWIGGEGIPWKETIVQANKRRNAWRWKKNKETKRRKTLEQGARMGFACRPKACQSKVKLVLLLIRKPAGEEIKGKEATLELYIPPGPRLGVVIEVNGSQNDFIVIRASAYLAPVSSTSLVPMVNLTLIPYDHGT